MTTTLVHDLHVLSDETLDLDAASAHAERIAEDWSAGVDHGDALASKLVAAKYHVTSAARRVVDLALEVTGGAAMFRPNELERLYRDVRCGGFHPANAALTHEILFDDGVSNSTPHESGLDESGRDTRGRSLGGCVRWEGDPDGRQP